MLKLNMRGDNFKLELPPLNRSLTVRLGESERHLCLVIYAVLHDQTITKPSDVRVVDITDEQWSFMESIVPLLNRSEEYPTLNGVYSILFSSV